MKKILFLSALYCSIMSASAFAKEGPSISIESSKMNIDQSFANVTYLGSNDKTLPTLGYGYQFEFGKFFIKPSFYYTFGDVEIKDTDGTNDKSTFKPVFSFEGDFGYEITDHLGLFTTLGIMGSKLEREVSNLKDTASTIGIIFGAGVKYDIIEELSLTAKYQAGKFNYGVNGSSEDFEVDANLIRVGLSYNF